MQFAEFEAAAGVGVCAWDIGGQARGAMASARTMEQEMERMQGFSSADGASLLLRVFTFNCWAVGVVGCAGVAGPVL